MGMLKRWLRDSSGQDLAEYGIALAVISGLSVAAALVINNPIIPIWNQASAIIASAV